jgi:hypothetical protein
MTAVKITVELDGQSHDIKDCAWYFLSPCGCTHGVMTTRNNGWITSAEQAHAEMTPNRAVREQDKKLGETVELGLHSECMTRLRAECPHTPQWGRKAIPEGTAWGRTSSGRATHIVDQMLPDDNDYRMQWREPKCGGKRDLFEIHPSALSDAPMCKKCLAFAAAEVAA